MPKKMLINALHSEEARVAIVEDGRLMDLGIEIAGREQTRGNVYKGVVVRVEPGLQAAFIDIGLKKLGFLQMGELHPEYWQWRDDTPPENRNRRPRIQEVLRRGQELLVQVEKGERDMKGAAVTSYLSLPGRYMVLMPGSDSAGVSRKVEAEGERKKLKEMAAELEIPEGIGYIMRTEALGKKQAELAKDFHYLLKLNESIREAAAKVKGPALIYQESDLIIRTIRDYFTAEIDEILVDSVEVFEQAKTFFKEVMPRMAGRVKLHQEKRPIFSRYQLEEQIDQIYEKKALLKSGGSLVIEPAEALVSIDVNSGKSTGEKGVEDTAFKTNMEAAEEVARQLRLRDLGGLIVIDFIDMRDRKHTAEVEKNLKHALKSDKARVTVGKISQFGLLEMSRQRIRQTANEAVYMECPHCEGRGRIKSVEAMAVSFLRKIHAAAAKGSIGEVRGGLPLEVAYYLLNRKKEDLARIEADYDIEVTLKGKPSFLMNQIELELIKREKAASDGQADLSQVPLVTAPVFPPEEQFIAEAVSEDFGDTPESEADTDGAEDEQTTSGLSAASVGNSAKKKKRRRKRGKSGVAAHPETGDMVTPESAEAEAATDPDGTVPAVDMEPEDGEEMEPDGEEAKKKRRRRRRGKKRTTEETGNAIAHEESPEEIAEPAAMPESAPLLSAPTEPEGVAASETVLKPRRARAAPSGRKKVAAKIAPEIPAPDNVESVPSKKRGSTRTNTSREPVSAEETPTSSPRSAEAEARPVTEPTPHVRVSRKKKNPEPVSGETILPTAVVDSTPAERKRAPRKKRTPAPDENV